jgi:threonine dehydratase
VVSSSRRPAEAGWPDFQDVERAAALLAGVIRDTPCVASEAIARACGAEVFLKLENLQRDGSYKLRGAYTKLATLAGGTARGVIAASAGNHAIAVARAAGLLGMRATIVAPVSTPPHKLRRIAALDAHVLLHGSGIADATAEATRLASEEELTFVPAYDDAAIVAGAGTIGLEIMRASRKPDTVLVPAGGGGLVCGIALAVKSIDPSIEIVAVQSAAFPSLRDGIGGRPPSSGGTTLAEGIAVATAGVLNLARARAFVDDAIAVDDAAIERAMSLLLEEERCVAEGAGAAAVAALLEHRGRFAGTSVVAIVSGGNLDTGLLASVIAREQLREGRVARLRMFIHDGPGRLAAATSIIAGRGANVLDVAHHRTFPDVAGKVMQLDVTIELGQPHDLLELLEELRSAGFKTTLPDAGVIA